MKPLTYTYQACPHRARWRLGLWYWSVTDGPTGPVLEGGKARTEWGCNRKLERTLARCRPFQVVRIAHPPLHPLTDDEAKQIRQDLADEGIRIILRFSLRDVEVVPVGQLTTWQQAAALHAVCRRTDVPVHWAVSR